MISRAWKASRDFWMSDFRDYQPLHGIKYLSTPKY